MRPMLATSTTHVPQGAQWTHEVKWDGVRILMDVSEGRPRMLSRNGNVVSIAWPELCSSPLGDRDVLLDGEAIALNEGGLPDFRVLAERMHVRKDVVARRLAERIPATYMVFDLLRLDGKELHQESLERRRELLAELPLDQSRWQRTTAYDDGQMLFTATLQQGLEGVVSKRLGSPYRYGERSKDWLKLAHRHRDSFVVGGWRPMTGSETLVGSLLVGEPGPGGLVFRGRVGSGIGNRAGRMLKALLLPLASDRSPFADEVPREDSLGTHWVEPVVVVDVDTHRRTPGQRLRQPSYRGVRSDLGPEDVT